LRWCLGGCGELFRAHPDDPEIHCEKHRKPRVRLVDGVWVLA
jgi:hypothetical protein